MDADDEPIEDKGLRAVVVVLLAMFLFRNAWVGDDAYVTLRTIDHFVGGDGLVYNIGERAQAYTHPLWMLLLLPFYAVFGNPWWTAVVVGVATTLAATLVVSRRLVPAAAAPLLLALPLSRAFVDYGTSGLENPLSHLLIAGLAAAWLGVRDTSRRLSYVALFTALLGLTRPDLLALAAPCLLAAAWSARRDMPLREMARRLAVGLSPLVVWHAFALIYYGSLLPTSALAKLDSGVPGAALAKQGMIYLLFQAEWDPLTLVVLVAGIAAPFVVRDAPGRVLAIGAALYVAYVVRVGGDFMAGRFLTAPMLVGLVLLARLPLDRPRAWGVAAVLVALSMSTPSSPLNAIVEVEYGRLNDRGIVDERMYYAARGAAIGSIRHETEDPPQHWRGWAATAPPDHVQVDEPVGYPAFYAARGVHWVCRYGITDPVLARLPPIRKIAWRAGHYDRAIPEGYLDSLSKGKNLIEAPDVARLYGALDLVNNAPTFSTARLRAIWRLNTGGFPIDPGPWRYPGARELVFGQPPYGSDALDAPGAITVDDAGAFMRLGEPIRATVLDFRRRDDVSWEVLFENDGETVGRVDVPSPTPRTGRLAWTRVDVPASAVRQGYDVVRVVPTSGAAPYVLHYLAPGR